MAARKKSIQGAASFIETMDCLAVATLPEGSGWTYELKLDGYRLEAVKTRGKVSVFSRRRTLLNRKFGYIAEALEELPDETVIDGELIAMNEDGHAEFNLLQNFKSAESKIHFYAFDLLVRKGKLLLERPLSERRALLAELLPCNAHISLSAVGGSASQMLGFVKAHGLEGIVAKRADSPYEPGKRSGLWSKYRVNLGQEFVIGGFTPGDPFDALIVGFFRGKDLMFAGRIRAGFVPATRREVFAKLKTIKLAKSPFANLPEKEPGRWGQGLTAEKMKSCRWVRPEIVVRIDFAEWTGSEKLRHAKFVALRFDKDPKKVVKET